MKHCIYICAVSAIIICSLPSCTWTENKKNKPAQTSVMAEVAIGELVDKITILKLKQQHVTDPAKLENINHELTSLTQTYDEAVPNRSATIQKLEQNLLAANQKLWVVEDDIRDCEANKDFGPKFIELSRSVYMTNDERCRIKRELNLALGSTIIEEKSYKEYQTT